MSGLSRLTTLTMRSTSTERTKMGKVVEAELLLKGTDKTGAAFAGVIKHAEELQAKLRGINYGAGNAALAEQGAEIRKNNSLLRAELALTQTINRAQLAGNTALAERATLFGRMRSHVQGIAAVGGMGWMIGGLASGRLAHAAAKDTGDFAHQRALLGAGGMTPAEVAKAERVAMALRVPLMSAADNIKAIGELRMVFNSTDHAIEHVGALQRAAAMMKAMNPQRDAEIESYNLARALEIKGVSSDPAHFNKLTNMMVQAINASHGKITGSEFFEFTKYTRGGANRLSDEFYTRVAPTLIQELGGHSAGMALSSFRQTLVGGKMTNRAAEEFVRLGLIDPKAVIHTKTGSVKGVRPGGLVDSALANENPYAWIQGYLKPALSKAKITDNNKIAEELAHLFGNRFAEQMASILLNQSQRIEKDWGLIAGAPSSEYLEKILAEDPQAAASNMSKAINTLLASLGGPLVQPAIDGMNKVSGWARSFADSYATFATEHPNAAKNASGAAAIGLGYASLKGFRATWGLLSGSTALKGSAAALAQSAVALDAAAVRLGAGGAVGNAVAGGAAAGNG